MISLLSFLELYKKKMMSLLKIFLHLKNGKHLRSS